MALDTQTFPLERHWLSAALTMLPKEPKIFSRSKISLARRTFLAGANQLTAIKNWLWRSDLIATSAGRAELTELGRLVAAHDENGQQAWTWWLIHLHLCANSEAYPYPTFFCEFEPEGRWMTVDSIVEALTERQPADGKILKSRSVKTYFQGVERAYRPGKPLFELGLIERRSAEQDGSLLKIRRASTLVSPRLTAYATFLWQSVHFEHSPTVEARELLAEGVGKALGLSDRAYRDTLGSLHHDAEMSHFLQYRRAVNLDSVQFLREGKPILKKLRTQLYEPGEIKWA